MSHSYLSIATIFFELMALHALADFVFQGELMSRAKNRHSPIHNEMGSEFPAWFYWLSAHAIIHGGAVFLVTQSLMLGVIETVLHAVIDHMKCERAINFHVDQLLHLMCKIAYCIYIFIYLIP